MSDYELYHHGVKGMKWGIRRDRKKSSTLKSYRTSRKNDPKTDVLKINRPNSAARSYYRGERTHSFTTYKKQQSIMNQKISGLTKAEIENGRYRVARARNIKRKAASGVMGVAVGALVNPALAPVVALGANWLTGGHYYQGQSATYGSRRADRENKRKS